MDWVEVQIALPNEIAELVAAAVSEFAGGVEIRDQGTLIRSDENQTVLVALCAPADVDGLLEQVHDSSGRARAAGLPADPIAIRQRPAHEDEWRDVWKQYFKATRVGKTFVVRPSWDPGAVVDGDRVIDLDPGRAFGTGGHASTRMVIALGEPLPERMPRPVRRFLDLGCGSGILAIAAARLWPDAAGMAVDVDPEATACARENLERNRVGTVELVDGTFDDVAGPFDVVFANIQANVLLEIAGLFPARLVPGGVVILSGLLITDGAAVLDRYQALGFRLDGRLEEDEWLALRLIGPGAEATE